MRALLLAPIVLAAVVSATQPEQRSPLHAIRSSLVVRFEAIDPGMIPDQALTTTVAQCESACSNTVNNLNGCSSVGCLCTDENNKQLKECVDCLVKVGDSDAATSTGQSTLNTFVDGCKVARRVGTQGQENRSECPIVWDWHRQAFSPYCA